MRRHSCAMDASFVMRSLARTPVLAGAPNELLSLLAAQATVRTLRRGDAVWQSAARIDNLHQVMLSLEDAKLSFQLMVQVRNKLLEAYQDILRMQV